MRIRPIQVLLVGLVLVLAGIFSAGCTPDKTAPTLAPRAPTEVVAVGDVDVSEPVAVSVASQPVVTVEPFTDVECLTCHTDQERLVELAVEEEDAHAALSSGPG